MDPELTTRLANLRRQTDGNSSTGSSLPASLVLLGSSVSITSSTFSQSFSVASAPRSVEFSPTPVFADIIPAGLMRKLWSHGQTPKAANLHYPLQGRRDVLFYHKHKHGPYHGFANSSLHPVIYKGKKYPTSVHLYQSFKVRILKLPE